RRPRPARQPHRRPGRHGGARPAREASDRHFKMFYGDTALFGAWHAMESGLAFFGADRILFGTDMPFDPEKGTGFIRDTIAAMEKMRATDEERQKIYEGNARRLLRLGGPSGRTR